MPGVCSVWSWTLVVGRVCIRIYENNINSTPISHCSLFFTTEAAISDIGTTIGTVRVRALIANSSARRPRGRRWIDRRSLC